MTKARQDDTPTIGDKTLTWRRAGLRRGEQASTEGEITAAHLSQEQSGHALGGHQVAPAPGTLHAGAVGAAPPVNVNRRFFMRAVVASVASVPVAATIPAITAPSLAEAAPRAPSAEIDVELIKLAERSLAAEREHNAACEEYGRLENEWADTRDPRPEALRVRKTDAALGLPIPMYSDSEFYVHRGQSFDHRQLFSFDIDRLRKPTWPVGGVDCLTVCVAEALESVGALENWEAKNYAAPSLAARARADEIIAAFDTWSAKQPQAKPRAIKAAERRMNAACRRASALERKLAKMPARSIAGLIAKAQCAAAHFTDESDYDDLAGYAPELASSVFKDLLKMQAKASNHQAVRS